MKRNEMSPVWKGLALAGFICGIAYFLLELLRYLDILTDTQSPAFALFSVFWLGMGVRQEHRVMAVINYIIAAGYLLLSLLYLFTR